MKKRDNNKQKQQRRKRKRKVFRKKNRLIDCEIQLLILLFSFHLNFSLPFQLHSGFLLPLHQTGEVELNRSE